MEEDTETSDSKQNAKPWLFKKGQSGNPLGRPPGRSLKDRAKAYLAGLTDEEAVEFFEGMQKKDVWEMAEGKARQETDITTAGKPIIQVAPEILSKHAIDPSAETDSQG